MPGDFFSTLEPENLTKYPETGYPKGMSEERIDWHAAFKQALVLEFDQYADVLEIKPDYTLNAEPLQIDAVIIKRLKKTVIQKKIAAIFTDVNIIEYKSPDVYVSVQEFEKTLVYFHLYASLEKVSVGDLSLTLIVNKYPGIVEEYLKKEYRCAL